MHKKIFPRNMNTETRKLPMLYPIDSSYNFILNSNNFILNSNNFNFFINIIIKSQLKLTISSRLTSSIEDDKEK